MQPVPNCIKFSTEKFSNLRNDGLYNILQGDWIEVGLSLHVACIGKKRNPYKNLVVVPQVKKTTLDISSVNPVIHFIKSFFLRSVL